MTPAITTRILRGRRGPAALLGRGTRLLSLDAFGLALQPSFLDAGHKHELVGSILGRHAPSVAVAYPELRRRAEKKARAIAASKDQHEVALATISDHLSELLVDHVEAEQAASLSRFAIRTELDLGRVLGRPNPEALELHRLARDRGIATAVITDSSLPRDLVARIVRASGFMPDYVLVSSNEGRRKDSGLFQRLLSKSATPAEAVVHLGPDQHLDVDVPRELGISGYRAPSPPSRPGPEVVLGLTPPGGLDSLALALAAQFPVRTADNSDRGLELGYYAAGPLLVGFSTWLRRVIEASNPDHVLLCGPAGALLDRTLDIVGNDNERGASRHVLPPSVDGHCPVDRLASTVRLRQADRVLVAGLGLFDEPHRYVEKILNADGSGPTVTGAYLGLPHAPDASAQVWAFDDADDCPVRAAAYRRPEVLEALIRPLPEAAQDVSPSLRPFHGVGRGVALGAEMFAEDVEPWLHLDEGGLSPATIEPALRVITDPMPGEARILGPYPVRGAASPMDDQCLAALPPRTQAARRPGLVDAGAEEAPWTEGYLALARYRANATSRRGRRRHKDD